VRAVATALRPSHGWRTRGPPDFVVRVVESLLDVALPCEGLAEQGERRRLGAVADQAVLPEDVIQAAEVVPGLKAVDALAEVEGLVFEDRLLELKHAEDHGLLVAEDAEQHVRLAADLRDRRRGLRVGGSALARVKRVAEHLA
jgi:hypothetical protein